MPRKATNDEPLAGRLGASGAEALLETNGNPLKSRVTRVKPKPRLRRPKKASLPAEIPSVTVQPPVDRDEIARLAHSYWLERGGKGGSAEADWHRAEQALKARFASNQG